MAMPGGCLAAKGKAALKVGRIGHVGTAEAAGYKKKLFQLPFLTLFQL